MRIQDLGHGTKGGLARVSGTVVWEDSDGPDQVISMEADAGLVGDLRPNPNAFLLAAVMPALHRGESRVRVEGRICPELRNGLLTAMLVLQRIHGKSALRAVRIEATEGFAPSLPRHPARTGSFLSGGVDSLTTLRCNRADFPSGHPGTIRDGIVLHGLGVEGPEATEADRRRLSRVLASFAGLADECGLVLVPVRADLRLRSDECLFFSPESFGAALAAVAHQLRGRVSTALVASSASIFDRGPTGSHPLLDPSYASSSEVRLGYDGARLGRLEKVAMIADWAPGMRSLKVCDDPFLPEGVRNCGLCAKCLLTMVELLVCGKLEECAAFPSDDVTPEMLGSVRAEPPEYGTLSRRAAIKASLHVIRAIDFYFWRELIAPLRSLGRDDLAAPVEAKLKRCERHLRHVEGGGLRAAVKRLDARYLGGTLARLRGLAIPRAAAGSR